MTSIVDDTTIVKNYKGVPLIFSSSVIQMPQIQGKYAIFWGSGGGRGLLLMAKLEKNGFIQGGSGRLLPKEILPEIFKFSQDQYS